jgi:hypothetical protein
MDELEAAIRRRTAYITAYRFMLQNQRMNMSRLSEKLAKAGGAAKRLSDTIEARADALIARETELERRTEAVFSPHETILSEAESGLDAVERQLALMSNDPLQPSGASQEVAEVPPATFRAAE